MTTIEQLKAKVEAAEAYRTAADVTLARAQADLSEAQGDAERAAYYRAYAEAQESPSSEAHERFQRIADESNARRVMAGTSTLDSFSGWQRRGIQAAIERLRAAENVQ
jgi:hypothetical protein